MNENTADGAIHRPGLRRLAAAVAVAALGGTAALAACSDGAHSSASSTSPAQTTARTMNVFAQCMRGHGQTNFYYANPHSVANSSTPVFSIGGGYYVTGIDPQSSQFGSALGSCKHLLPPEPSRQLTKQQLDRDVKFAQCMHAHGFPSYPEPDVQNGQLIQQPLPTSIDTSSPQFQAAETACGGG
jgi:hypothetical protein